MQKSENAPKKELDFEIRKTRSWTLLTNKREQMRSSFKAGVKLDRIADDQLSTSKANNATKVDT